MTLHVLLAILKCKYTTEITSKVTEQERRETRRLSVDLTSEMLAEYVQQENKVRDLELS